MWGHPRGADLTLMLATGLEDDEVAPGTHVVFDCHGTLDLYCWDGGKTWASAPALPRRRARARVAGGGGARHKGGGRPLFSWGFEPLTGR